jgi:hypothetical protein
MDTTARFIPPYMASVRAIPRTFPSLWLNVLQASTGQNGQSGRNATSPTNGAPGRNISVALRHNPNRPARVQVVHGGQGLFELSEEESLLLDAHGGNGGHGGHGEVYPIPIYSARTTADD